jgi:hypothetical protein
MIISSSDAVAIMIALLSSVTVMVLFWRENIALRRQVEFFKEMVSDEFH